MTILVLWQTRSQVISTTSQGYTTNKINVANQSCSTNVYVKPHKPYTQS